MKAAALVKEFQGETKKEDEFEDPQLKLGRYLARGAAAADPGTASPGRKKSPESPNRDTRTG